MIFFSNFHPFNRSNCIDEWTVYFAASISYKYLIYTHASVYHVPCKLCSENENFPFFFCSDVCECCVCSSALVALRLIKMKILSAHDTLVPIKYQSTNVSLFGRYLNCCVRRPFIQLTAKQKSMLIRKSIGRRKSKNNSNHFRARIMSSKWFCYAWSEANKHRFGWKEILWIAIILNRFLFDCRWIGSVYTKLKWALKEPVIIA